MSRIRRLTRLARAMLVTGTLTVQLWPTAAARADVPGPGALGGLAASSSEPSIAASGWGRTDPLDLRWVLGAVAEDFASHFAGVQVGPIVVAPGVSTPMVLFRKHDGGAYEVQLTARDGRWYQFVYQFAHELCHIYSNYDNKPQVDGRRADQNQWFEESVCEAAALFELRALADRWASGGVEGRWREYAATLRRYADLLTAERHRRLPGDETLATWFSENRAALRANPYLREKDEVVANRLLQVFEQRHGGLATIAYLNIDRAAAGGDFQDYLAAWCLACPPAYRRVVEEIMAMFGAAPPAQLSG